MAGNISSFIPKLAKQLSGKAIQPQVVVVNQYQIDEISQNLREQISKSIKDMKALGTTEGSSGSPHAHLFGPISLMLPQEVNASLYETPKKRGKKVITSKVVGKFYVSYESILYDDESGSDTNKRHEFSFIHRLQNWNLQQRERSNGKMRDVYYIHMTSGITFRSMKEVVKFMIYEKYPTKSSNEKDKKPEFGEASVASNESTGKEKRNSDEEIDKLAMDKEKVEKFLAESYDNLMNWRPK